MKIMFPDCATAFKEWAVICRALELGRQTLILRKGGIQEGRDGFRVAHRSFWLFPTYLHQEERAKLVDEAWPILDEIQHERLTTDVVPLQFFANVSDVIQISDATLLPHLKGLHWWSEQTINERFYYKNPGLFLLIVRMFKLPQPHEIADSPHFAGCRSWVELPFPLSTSELEPVLTEDDFEESRTTIRNLVRA